MFRRQRPLWKTYRTEQRTATRRREGNARCNYARACLAAVTKPSAIIFTISVTDECWRDGDPKLSLPTRCRLRAVWIPRGEDPPVQPKANLYEKKCLLSCFWDAKGMLYYELLPQGRTINSTTYSNQLASLALALQEKCPRRSAVHLLHDNARPYVAKATQEKLQELNWDTVPHPPYLLDIAPSDYHLFRPLKLFLKEKRFAKYEDLKMAVFDSSTRSPPRFGRRASTTSPSDVPQL
uniref:Mariner Mos1 transposase n=1 Tax=Caenorhabditis japonica TaxID=281687 RepID=A0A8R1EQ01_CAEJA